MSTLYQNDTTVTSQVVLCFSKTYMHTHVHQLPSPSTELVIAPTPDATIMELPSLVAVFISLKLDNLPPEPLTAATEVSLFPGKSVRSPLGTKNDEPELIAAAPATSELDSLAPATTALPVLVDKTLVSKLASPRTPLSNDPEEINGLPPVSSPDVAPADSHTPPPAPSSVEPTDKVLPPSEPKALLAVLISPNIDNASPPDPPVHPETFVAPAEFSTFPGERVRSTPTMELEDMPLIATAPSPPIPDAAAGTNTAPSLVDDESPASNLNSSPALLSNGPEETDAVSACSMSTLTNNDAKSNGPKFVLLASRIRTLR
mmetsp:Transcript_41429/g.60780  ORF Transcript_41429/g.60780 Transcript_41429/m.60780 type:complete len:317 (-) Transcript_41429:2201-3151(-)